MRVFAVALLICAMACALFVGVRTGTSQAAQCSVWYRCPVTQRYGQNWEHGVDLATHGLAIGALRSGVVTFDSWECWDGECVQDVTWRLDFPSHAGGSRYMYLQIATSCVHVGEHVVDNQKMGMSGEFIEFGLTPDWAYGVSNWRWGIDPLRVWSWL